MITELFGQKSKDSLIVFVGEMIEVKHSPEKEKPVDTIINGKDTSYAISISMDSRYIAKYKIIQLVHGTFKADTIEFMVYDHYGIPRFSKFKTVLLFVSIIDGVLYHEKYQYFDLYLTKSRKWASPYATSEYKHSYKDQITVIPEKIKFKRKVSFSLDKLTKKQIELRYPAPYYKVKNSKAIAIYGNYVNDLYKLKLERVLKARGYY